MPLPAAHDPNTTPAMRQYQRFKAQYPDCLLFFRMGDFYEMFHEDALLAHRVLNVTLTQRTQGVPMAGVPYHAVENYLRRLIQAGYRVAVCDQVEDPAQAKGIVQRDVTRVVTPGTLTDEALLDEGRENPLAAVLFLGDATKPAHHSGGSGPGVPPVHSGGGNSGGAISGGGGGGANSGGGGAAAIAWAELSTGAFHLATVPTDTLAQELGRIAPRELLFVETADHQPPPRIQALRQALNCALTPVPLP